MRHTVWCALARGIAMLGFLTPSVHADPIDSYLRSEMAARKIPGLAVAIVRGDRIERISVFGFANVENAVRVSDSSIFAIASLDKALTCAGVLKAEEHGRLLIDELVSKYVPLPFRGITIRQLLSHTSGLPDSLAELDSGRRFTAYSTEQLLDSTRRLTPVAPPGSRLVYSDVGMFLAQNVTERATGEPWWTFMRREVFEPAGMHSVVSMNPQALIAGRVSAYTLNRDGQLTRDTRLEIDYGPLYNDLGMTIGDFARWIIALDGSGALTPPMVAALTTPAVLADGTPAAEVYSWTRYGLGLGVDDIFGERVVMHAGHSGVGFVKLLDRGVAAIVFTNLENLAGSDPVGLALGVAGMVERRVGLRGLQAARAPDEELAAALHRDYELFAAGTPDLMRYATGVRATLWAGTEDFADRVRRLGALRSFEFLREQTLDGDRAFWFRATYAGAAFYVRFSIDSQGLISRLGWWHL